MNADQAMLTKIKQKGDDIHLTFDHQASQYVKAADIIQGVAQTRFKSTLGTTDDGAITVRLIIQPKMTQQDWLQQLLKLVEYLADLVQDAQDKQDIKK